MFLCYERSLQPDLVGAGIIVPIAGLVGGLDPCRAVSIGADSPKRSGGFEARYRYKVAPRRVPIVLALEVTTSWWPTNLTDRDTQAYPRDEHRQPAVGRAADPRRVA